MSPVWGHLVGIGILMLMSLFVGIWYWAWRPRHQRAFEALAALPMMDGNSSGEKGLAVPGRSGLSEVDAVDQTATRDRFRRGRSE